ncbi:MAG: hypothetical protein ACI4NB_05715 [Candidatus Ornithospirochaeta sp.]
MISLPKSPGKKEGVLPHLDSYVVSSIFTALLKKGEKDNLVSLAPFMDGDDLEGVISHAIGDNSPA